MKKIFLAAMVAAAAVSVGFGDSQECIDDCIHKDPNKNCTELCLEKEAVGALSSVKSSAAPQSQDETPEAVGSSKTQTADWK